MNHVKRLGLGFLTIVGFLFVSAIAVGLSRLWAELPMWVKSGAVVVVVAYVLGWFVQSARKWDKDDEGIDHV